MIRRNAILPLTPDRRPIVDPEIPSVALDCLVLEVVVTCDLLAKTRTVLNARPAAIAAVPTIFHAEQHHAPLAIGPGRAVDVVAGRVLLSERGYAVAGVVYRLEVFGEKIPVICVEDLVDVMLIKDVQNAA